MKKDYKEVTRLLFAKDGLLARALHDYEEREGQQSMALQIFEAYDKGHIALIEAGTGIGKSLAYALPAVTWALYQNEKTVISTHTIALQEQLFNKDLPFLLKILDVDLKVVLVKGMGNYLCLKKYEEYTEQSLLFSSQAKETASLEQWKETTSDGSRSSIQFPLSALTWEKVNAESDSCTHVHCPHYKKCFFFKARKQSEDAHVLIVNHHLLFADMLTKAKNNKAEEKSILPNFSRMILDEAHHIEQIALDALSVRVHRLELFAILARLVSDHVGSCLFQIRQKLVQFNKTLSPLELQTLSHRIEIDFPAQKKDLLLLVDETFSHLKALFPLDSTQKIRLREDAFSKQPEVIEAFQKLIASLKSFSTSMFSLIQDLQQIKNEGFLEKLKPVIAQTQSFSGRLEEKAEALEQFFSPKKHRVRWLEQSLSVQGTNLTLVEAALDVSTYLRDMLFEKHETVSLCSATLATNQNFSFLKKNLGITQVTREISEQIYPSPFDYPNRCLLAVPSDICDLTDPLFTTEASDFISQLLKVSQGSAFVLFTSYEMLLQSYELVKAANKNMTLLKQGDASRSVLTRRFQSAEGQVLFGTDSFWEGIDIPGDALRLVIIARLPFKVPNDPMVEGYMEFLTEQGRDPFIDYSVPQAAIKFKQGFGRLIRKKTDHGCVVCLDKRLVTKAYGKIFLKTLPEAKIVIEKKANILNEMQRFYHTAKA